MITVHATVTSEAVSNLSGVLLVANMSNNDYDFTDKAVKIANNNPNNMIGFIMQNKIDHSNLVCMTPGISNKISNVHDQNYRSINDVDTDYIILGRALYNSQNIEEDILKFI